MKEAKTWFPKDAPVGVMPLEMLSGMAGIDQFKAMIAGDLPGPSIARTMNFILTKAEPGMAEFRGEPTSDHYNPLGMVHGGWAATILDSALGCAVHTMLPPGLGYTTVEFKVNLIRGLQAGMGELVCTGTVLHFGRTTAVSEAKLTTLDGKLLAMGTETCAVFPLPGAKG